MCADGSPVPGAEVTAYDVDFFWWWSSILQIDGTAVTDASGHFAIKFRWCCGWWPWWWWLLRQWRLDYDLVAKIQPVLKFNPQLKFPRARSRTLARFRRAESAAAAARARRIRQGWQLGRKDRSFRHPRPAREAAQRVAARTGTRAPADLAMVSRGLPGSTAIRT